MVWGRQRWQKPALCQGKERHRMSQTTTDPRNQMGWNFCVRCYPNELLFLCIERVASLNPLVHWAQVIRYEITVSPRPSLFSTSKRWTEQGVSAASPHKIVLSTVVKLKGIISQKVVVGTKKATHADGCHSQLNLERWLFLEILWNF